MRLRDVMSHTIISLKPEDTVETAMRVFVKHAIKGAPVLAGGKVVGIVSQKDMFRALYPSVNEYYDNPELWMEEQELEDNAKAVVQKKISEIMTPNPITAPADIPIMQAGAMMLAHRVHRVLVMEADKLVGIATRADVFRSVFKRFLS